MRDYDHNGDCIGDDEPPAVDAHLVDFYDSGFGHGCEGVGTGFHDDFGAEVDGDVGGDVVDCGFLVEMFVAVGWP